LFRGRYFLSFKSCAVWRGVIQPHDEGIVGACIVCMGLAKASIYAYSFHLGLMGVMRVTQALELVDEEGFFAYPRPREQVVYYSGWGDYAFCFTSRAYRVLTQLYLSQGLPLPCLIHRVKFFAFLSLVEVRGLLLFAAMLHAIGVQFALVVLAPEAGTLLVCRD